MTRAALPLATLSLALMVIGAAITGCQPDASSSGTTDAAANSTANQPTPAERFDRVVTTFRNAIDTDSSGVATGIRFDDATGHTSISVRKNVTDVKLIPPTKQGEPYRGTITVVWHSSYSMRMPASGDADADKSSGKNGDPDQPEVPDASAEGGVDVLDPNLIAAATKNGNRSPVQEDEFVARRTEEDERTYELEYDNNRWVLKTALDPETETSIQYAFEHALSTQ